MITFEINEIQKAMQSLYKACKAQYSSKDSCLACPLCDKDAIPDDDVYFCLANHPHVWDAFYSWLKTGDSAETSLKKYGENDNEAQD